MLIQKKLPQWHSFNRTAIALSLYICSIFISGCYQQYYQTQTKTTTDADMLKKLQNARKYFILHLPDRNVGLSNMAISDDELEADEFILPKEHTEELKPYTGKENVVRQAVRDSVLMEVHLYTNVAVPKNEKVRLKTADINRIDVYEFDARHTKTSNAFSTIGVIGGTLIGVSFLGMKMIYD